MKTLHFQYVGLALIAAVLSGCAGDTEPERFELEGNVTFAGQPVAAGRLQFVPDTRRGGSGPAGFAVIENGKYDTRLQGRGTVGGPHYVMIDGFDGDADPDNELPAGRNLFRGRRAEADFPASDGTIDFEVPKDSLEPAQATMR